MPGARKNKQKAKTKKRGGKRWAPPFASGDAGPVWRNFWVLLAAAAALRLLAAITGGWLMRTDELFQYLEQAHRLVFGYGQIPWEYRFGMRTWILPSLSALPLWFAKIAGWDSPEIYAPLVRSFHALLSLTVPAGMYFFTRRIHSEGAARAAFVFGCFWHEMVVMSPHPIAENSAATAFFAALLLVLPEAGALRRAAAGFLLGMVAVFRVHYIPPAGLIGLLMLLPPPHFARAAPVVAGLLAVLFAGGLDYFAWGGFFETYINYFNLQTSGYADYAVKPAPFTPLRYMFTASAGLFFIVAAASLFYLSRLWLPLALFLLVQIPHNILVYGEYTNTFLGAPFALMLAGCLTAEWLQKRAPKKRRKNRGEVLEFVPPKHKAAALAGALFFASLLAHFGALPNQRDLYVFRNERPFFYRSPFFEANLAVSRRPAENVKSVVFLIPRATAHSFGGYYYAHRDAPMWFPFSEDYDRDALGLKGMEQNAVFSGAGKLFARSASHLVVPRGLRAEGFSPAAETGHFALLENDDISRVTVLPGAVYDIMDNGILGVLRILDKRLKVISQKEKPLSAFRRLPE